MECLMKAGFTRPEALLYVTLCREGELTGYEAAKVTSIPRSNAYLALAGLVDKGGAFKLDGDISKYSAVPVRELVFNLRRQMEQVYSFIEENAPVRENSSEPYFTITGRQNVINKMSYIISHAQERIYISTSMEELDLVGEELLNTVRRGLKVVVITSPGFEMDGAVIHYNEKQPGQIRLIADTAHVFTGEICGRGESTGLYSKNRNLIQLIKDSLTNEIRLIQMKTTS